MGPEELTRLLTGMGAGLVSRRSGVFLENPQGKGMWVRKKKMQGAMRKTDSDLDLRNFLTEREASYRG
jgi:hypothetical protein